MKVKQGVIFGCVQPQIILAMMVTDACYQLFGYDLVITSICDGVHKVGSLHYKGYACDTRTRDIPNHFVTQIADALRVDLGAEFDVVIESNHIHIEFDPK